MSDPIRLEYFIHEKPPPETIDETHKCADAMEEIILLAMDSIDAEDQVIFSGFLSATGSVMGIALENVLRLTRAETEDALAEYGAFITRFLRKWSEKHLTNPDE